MYKMAEEKLANASTSAPEVVIQDPVVFLSSVQEACPDVISMLNTKQARLLSRSPTEPYDPDPKDINEQYLVDLASFYGIKQKVENARHALQNQLLTPNKVKEEVDVASFTLKLEVLEKVVLNDKLDTGHCSYYFRLCV